MLQGANNAPLPGGYPSVNNAVYNTFLYTIHAVSWLLMFPVHLLQVYLLLHLKGGTNTQIQRVTNACRPKPYTTMASRFVKSLKFCILRVAKLSTPVSTD